MTRPITKHIEPRCEELQRLSRTPYKPRPIEPPRAGSMRASTLPSCVADRLIYPRGRRPA